MPGPNSTLSAEKPFPFPVVFALLAGAPESVVVSVPERGHTSCSPEQPSTCVFKLATPAVRAAAQRHFGCGSLQGAELENQDTGSSILASHWEMRLFNSELMNPFSMCAHKW